MEESLSLRPATGHALLLLWRSWRQWLGKELFRQQEREGAAAAVSQILLHPKDQKVQEPCGPVLPAVSPLCFQKVTSGKHDREISLEAICQFNTNAAML